MTVHGQYDGVLVALAIVVAAFASYTALDLVARAASHRGTARLAWLSAAAVALGAGIWSMHFIAMLAFRMPLGVAVDPGLAAVSFAIPIVAAACSFHLLTRGKASPRDHVLGGLLIGGGIAGMHFTAMAGLRMAAQVSYQAAWIAVAILVATGAATAALWLAFRADGRVRKFVAAAVMAIAIASLHFVAMRGTVLTAQEAVESTSRQGGLFQTNLALAIALAICAILTVALCAAALDRRIWLDADTRMDRIAAQMRRTPRYLTVLVAASLLVPAVVFGLAAWQNWKQLESIAAERASRTVGILAEHAHKVFDTTEQMLAHLDAELSAAWQFQAGRDVRSTVDRVWVTSELDHVADLGIATPDGSVIAAEGGPAPSRDAFEEALQRLGPFSPGVVESTITVPGRAGESAFHLMRRGSAGRTLFAGLSPLYFVRFYRSVTEGEDSVTMARDDGTLLVRDPPATTGIRKLSANSGLMRGVARSERGTYRVVSELDGVERIHAYQKIAEHPAYVSYGLSITSIAREWRANLIAYGVVAALSALALSSLSAFALLRASQERRLFMRWRMEAERREAAEEALRQAQKMEAVGQLTGGIAHDFNNLLTVVVGNLEIAGRALDRHDPEKAKRNIAAAVQGADRAATLTHRLLAFSRRQPLQPSAVDINEVVTGMTDLFRRTLGESIRIETVLAKDLWPAHADRNQLESAFLNLVINSRDAMPDGGLVTIRTGNVWIEAGRASADADVSPGPQVMVSVSDTGIGMSPAVHARAFEPFFTTKQVGQGTGLGLSMIYGFVKQSGGHIRIDSEPDRGTDVRIYLPRAELNVPTMTVSSGGAPRARRGEAVLVVEDDADVRAFAVEALSSLGYRILQARDAASALAVLRFEEKIALLFTDVGLPGPNGRDLAEKAVRLRPDLKVLFTTGYAPEAMILDPGTHLLKKPFTVEELANSVRRAIEAGPAVLESV